MNDNTDSILHEQIKRIFKRSSSPDKLHPSAFGYNGHICDKNKSPLALEVYIDATCIYKCNEP